MPRLQGPAQRTVLLADPGMGKSTVIQLLIATLAAGSAPEDAKRLQGAVPFPFILRELRPLLPPDVKDWNWDALLDAFRRWNPRGAAAVPIAAPLTVDDSVLHDLLASERAFFLIDGLDEIGDPERRTAIRDSIWEGFERHANARWLVTSRIVGYDIAALHFRVDEDAVAEQITRYPSLPAALRVMRKRPAVKRGVIWNLLAFTKQEQETAPNFDLRELVEPHIDEPATLLYLAPFDDTQQRAFAEHWYVPRMKEKKDAQRAGEFIAAVHQHPHTRVIGRVPNLLYLLALLYRHEANLPNGRALVYEAISRAYLETIPLQRRLPDAAAITHTFPQKEELLAIVGMKMQEQRASRTEGEDGDILVSREQLEEWLGPRFASAADLHCFLDHVARHSGLLLPRGEGVYGFAHLSFQEYYAACHLQKDFERILNAKSAPAGGILRRAAPAATADEERVFATYAALAVWHEPLLFLVERLRASPDFTLRLLEWMFPQLADDPRKGDKWMPFPAAHLLATLSLDPEVALDDAQRADIWKALWQAHIAAFRPGWNLAPSLVVAASTYQSAVLRVAAALQPEQLHLLRCTGMSDLTPLQGLTGLRDLWLHNCTGVSDLAPLQGLTSLQVLILDGCPGVNDLAPLQNLTRLQALDVRDCAVSDWSVARRLRERGVRVLGIPD